MCGGSGGGEGGVDSTQADKDLDENLMVKLQVSILNYQAGIYIFSIFLLSIYWPTTGGGMSNKHGVMQGGHLNIQRKKDPQKRCSPVHYIGFRKRRIE